MTDPEPSQEKSAVHTIPADLTYQEVHRSYLLRLWRTSADGSWRTSLQSIASGERHMFADLDRLLVFLFTLSQ